jgi:hypothetical protein
LGDCIGLLGEVDVTEAPAAEPTNPTGTAAGNSPEETPLITLSQNSPHARPGVAPLERDRVAAIFNSSEVNTSATTLLAELSRSLEEGGTRRLITHAIGAAASGIMDNGQTKPLAEVEPTDVVRALESTIVEVQIEREAERVRQEAHRQAQQAVDAEWAELQVAVTERHDRVAHELARVIERQKAARNHSGAEPEHQRQARVDVLRSSGLAEQEAIELLGRAADIAGGNWAESQQSLEERARNLSAKLTRYKLFAADKRANFWQLYDIDSALDMLLEATAARLDIVAPV